MAKFDKKTNQYVPGIIYELRYYKNNEWIPFYVGETINPKIRKNTHKRCAKNEEERVVYAAIAVLEEENIPWDLFPVDSYGSEGPTDKEDQRIMDCILADHKLTNMKKGNKKWMEDRIAEGAEMKKHGFTNLKEYRKQKAEWDAIAAAEKVAAEQQRRKEEYERQQQRAKEYEEMLARIDAVFAAAAQEEQKRKQQLKEAEAIKQSALDAIAEKRARREAEVAAARAEQEARDGKRLAEQMAELERTAPQREAARRAENERLLAEQRARDKERRELENEQRRIREEKAREKAERKAIVDGIFQKVKATVRPAAQPVKEIIVPKETVTAPVVVREEVVQQLAVDLQEQFKKSGNRVELFAKSKSGPTTTFDSLFDVDGE